MNPEERLDAALSGDSEAFAVTPEVQRLIDTGDEVEAALTAWTLDPVTRADIYATALAMVESSGFGNRLRALGLDRRAQAIAGGAVVTIAAAAAVSVAVARGRRHAAGAPAALGA